MKNSLYIILASILLFSCQEPEVIAPTVYACNLTEADQSASHPDLTALQTAFDKVGKAGPNIQAAIKTPDGNTWTSAYGMADIANNISMNPCHKTMIGSISKIFTAVLIMQLQDDGILDVDDPLSDWLGSELIGEIENANEVSLRQLLNHTSGIRDYLEAKQYINALNTPFFQETQAEKLRYIYGKKAVLAPGERYSYSNSNYVLLGLVIEEARNMPLWDAVETYITQPLGLLNAEMGTHDKPIPAGTSRPYRYIRGGKYEDILSFSVSDAATGDGGMASNMQDLNLFIEALFSGKLLSADAFNEMIGDQTSVPDNQADFDWPDEGYGLGISKWNSPYGVAYGHTGGTSTYATLLIYFPDQEASLAIGFTSEASDEGSELRNELGDILFDIMF